MLKRLLFIVAIVATAASASAQSQAAIAPYKFDFGVNIGMSGYIGETNGSNPLKHP